MSKQININPCTGETNKHIQPDSDINYIDPLYNDTLSFTFKDMSDKAISHISCDHGKFVFELLRTISQKTWNDIMESSKEFNYHSVTLERTASDIHRISSKDLHKIKEVVPHDKSSIHRIGLRKDTDKNRRIVFDKEDNSSLMVIYHIGKEHYD